MKIFELFEQTVAPTPPGSGTQLGTTKPTEQAPQSTNTPQTPTPTGTPPSTQAGQTTTPPPADKQMVKIHNSNNSNSNYNSLLNNQRLT